MKVAHGVSRGRKCAIVDSLRGRVRLPPTIREINHAPVSRGNHRRSSSVFNCHPAKVDAPTPFRVSPNYNKRGSMIMLLSRNRSGGDPTTSRNVGQYEDVNFMKSIRFRPIGVEPYAGPSKFKLKVAGSSRGCLSIIAPLVLLIPHPGRAQPSNDAFADAQPLSVSAGSVTGTNVGATKEAGEPNHAGNPGGHSVWYRWTAPFSGSATIDTLGSDFDTLLGVYTGNSVSSLTTIASNDDISDTNRKSRVSFTPVAGATYQIAVDGWGGATGTITLNWTQSDGNLPDLIIWGPSISPRIT